MIEATTGDSAKVFLEQGARVDLVVTDVRMPGTLNGIQLARWIKCNREEVPVILVSGEITERDLPDVAAARFVKPVDVGRLIEKVRNLVERQSDTL